MSGGSAINGQQGTLSGALGGNSPGTGATSQPGALGQGGSVGASFWQPGMGTAPQPGMGGGQPPNYGWAPPAPSAAQPNSANQFTQQYPQLYGGLWNQLSQLMAGPQYQSPPQAFQPPQPPMSGAPGNFGGGQVAAPTAPPGGGGGLSGIGYYGSQLPQQPSRNLPMSGFPGNFGGSPGGGQFGQAQPLPFRPVGGMVPEPQIPQGNFGGAQGGQFGQAQPQPYGQPGIWSRGI